METVTVSIVLDVLRNFGPVGLIAFMWWKDVRDTKRIMDENKQYINEILVAYKADMNEIRRMYESNVRLVEDHAELIRNYGALSKDLKDAYIMNAQAFQRMADDIEGNQFCPMVRLKKQAEGVQ